MKALRLVLAVVGGLLALVLIAVVYLVNSFDPNDYKDEITAYVQERTGRSLSIDESIELSLFPWFAVETGGVKLSDDPAFGERSFAEIDELSARVRVWPLLKRRVEIGRVILDGISLNLGADAEGRGNWASLVEATVPAADDEPAATEPAEPSIRALAIESIELRNARILWHDADGEVRYLIRDLDLASGAIRDDDPIALELSFSALDVASQASLQIALETVADLPERRLEGIDANLRLLDARQEERARAELALASLMLDGSRIRLAAGEIDASLRRPPIGPDSLPLTAAYGAAEFDLATEALSVTGLSVESGGSTARLTLSGERLRSAPALAGTVELESRSIAELSALLSLSAPAEIDLAALGGLTGSARFALGTAPLAVELEQATLTAAGLTASGRAALAGDGGFSARIEIPPFAPSPAVRRLLAGFVPAETDLGVIARASASASVSLSPSRDRLEIADLDLAIDALRLAADLSVSDPGRTPSVRGRLSASGLDNRLLAGLAGGLLPAELVATPLGEFRLSTDLTYSAAASRTSLEALALTAYGLSGEGNVLIDGSRAALALTGRASLAEFSPRALLTRFGLPVPASADPSVLGSARLSAAFETTGDNGYFRDISLRLDDSSITGEFSVENFADPSYRFALNADRIDADRYLPPQDDDPPEAATAEAPERKLGDLELAREPLSATTVTGSASVGELTLGGLRFQTLSTDLAVGGGRAALDGFRTNLYGGSFAGSFAVDASGELAGIRLTGTGTELALEPLLDALIGDSNLSGTGNLELDLTGQGNTLGEAMQSAAGRMSLSLQNGSITGFNLGRELCATVNRARGLAAPPPAAEITNYSVIRASTSVSQGVASTEDLYAATSFLNLTGRGSIRLVDQWLDTAFRASVTAPIALSGCEYFNSRLNDPVPINFTVKGQLPDVDIGVDISQLLEDWARRELRQRTEEAVIDRLLDIFN